MGTAVVAKDFSTKVSKVQVVDEATARQWYAETRVNLNEDSDTISPITFQARQIMIKFLPAEEYDKWYEKCEAWTLGHDDDGQTWTDHDAAMGVVDMLCDINNKFGVGDITNDQIEEIVIDAAASMSGLSKIVTKDDWKSFYGHYLSLDKRDFRKFSGQTIVDFISFLFNKITKMEDDEQKKFEKANEAAASHKSIHELGNDLWYFFHHDSSFDDEYEPEPKKDTKEPDQKLKAKLERRAKIQELIAGLYDMQTDAENVISVVLDDKKRDDIKKVKNDAKAESKKDSKADVVVEDAGTSEASNHEVIDATVVNNKVVENPPAVKSTIDLSKLIPAPIPEDQYHDLMDQVQKAQPYIPWHVTRAAVSALLNCINKIPLESIFDEIKSKNDQTGQEWYPVYAEIVNAITAKYSPLGPVIPGVQAKEIAECISKDALLNIATSLDNQLGGDEGLEQIIEKIRNYKAPQAAESDVTRNPFVYVNAAAAETSVLPESVAKAVKKAFGNLLDNRVYTLESISGGNIIQLNFPDRQQAYWIDPSIIIGDGFNLYWQADVPIMINIAKNRDIIQKILDNPAYALTPEEYNRVRAGQFKNDGLYDCLDMSGMSKNINNMNADTMFKFEEKLNKIFGINPQTGVFANPVFQGYGKLFRFRFSKFKNIDDFTLVSDEKVKSPVQGVNDVLPGLTVLAYKNNYIVKYNEQSYQIDF